MTPVRRLRGMRDQSQAAWLRQQDLLGRLRDLLGSYGYQFLDMPILEPTELFLRKSGGELASKMYSFVDAGSNQVSLRPEFTSPIMRHYLEHASEIDLPVRWQYAGPVFRYDASHVEATGQFHQVGAELLGSDSVLADAELLTLAAQVPLQVGLEDYTIELADLEVLHSVLDVAGVSDRARTFIVAELSALREGTKGVDGLLEKAATLHLAGYGPEDDYLSAAIEGLDDPQARRVLQGLLHWSGGESVSLGQRDPEEVVDRLLRKLRGSDDTGQLQKGLELASQLAVIRGEPGAALAEARQVVEKSGADPAALERLGGLIRLVEDVPGVAGRVTLDFGLARGLAYYNGIIFEIKHPAATQALGGGGRYDGLARALGSPETVPALGFAYTVESLVSLAGASNNDHVLAVETDAILVSPEGPDSRLQALRVAAELRRAGTVTELYVGDWGNKEGLAYARKRGFSQVITVSAQGRKTAHAVEAGAARE